MKKTYFVIAAVVAAAITLAVLIAGCDGSTTSPEESTGDSEEGLKISFRQSNGGRALTTPIAAAGADYFEVVFDNGTRKVRTSWGGGATGRIIPGNGDYDNSSTTGGKGKAYIFAGRNNILFGVGVLVDVLPNDSAPLSTDPTYVPTTVIDIATAREVVFEITALNTDVGGLKNPANVGGAGPNPDASTFTIELEPGEDFSGNMVGTVLLDSSQNPPLSAPVFVVIPSSNPAGLAATFDITNTNGISLGVTTGATPSILALHADLRSAIKTISIDPEKNRVISTGYLWEGGNSPFAGVTGEITSITAAGAALTLPIALNIKPGTKAGLARVSIEIPVVLYDNVAGDNGADPYPWYIKGGINNTLADQGAAFNDGDGSLGGAILIGVGEYNKNAAGLIVSFSNPK